MRIKNSQKGFTLTELAIVLGAIGFLFGGVWVASSVVWDNYRFNRVKEDLFQTVQNVQNYYGIRGGIPGGDLTDVLDDDDRRLIPMTMRSTPQTEGNAINHELAVRSGGSEDGTFVAIRQTTSTFQTVLRDLDKAACVKMLMQFPVLLPELGVRRMSVGLSTGNSIVETNGTAVDPHNPATPSATVTLPLTLVDANTWCAHETSNWVGYVFTIRP